LFSNQIIFVFASGLEANTSLLAARFLRISIFSIYFIGICGVFSAYLKIKGDYFSPSIIGIVLSITEIISCIIAFYYSDIILAVGITIAAFAQFLVVFISAIIHGYRRNKHLGFRNEYIKRAVLMSLPIMIGLGVDEINVIVDRTIASGFDSGSISSLNYANTLVAMVHNIISVSINTVLFTEVSRLAATNDRRQIALQIQSSIQSALFFLIPATIGIIVYAEPIIQILYERGNFTHQSTIVTAGVMIFYAFYIVPNGIRLLSQSYFYAYGKTKFCMYIGFLAVAVNIFFNLMLSRKIGINGLALATSIGVTIGAVILFARLIYENREIDIFHLIKITLLILLNAIVMAAATYVLYISVKKFLPLVVTLIMVVIFSVIIYFILSVITKTLDKSVILKLLHKKG
jgi:putative peptidoglycan lipid II flippase